MERRKCWVFDVDGTLADNGHREHFIANKPKNWGSWYRRLIDDTPQEPVVFLLNAARAAGYAIVVCTGRGEMMHLTEEWFRRHNIHYDALYHRAEKDYRCDSIVKGELCDQILADGYDIFAVVDDRPRVVQMWRDRGYFVFDVNKKGEF